MTTESESHDWLRVIFFDAEPTSDLAHSPGREEPIFGSKLKANDYLAEKASEGVIEFTSIATGPFFDWGMYYETTFRRKGLTKGQD